METERCPFVLLEHAPHEWKLERAPKLCPGTPELPLDKPPQETLEEVDWVNHPPHYGKHPSGVECITIIEHFGFNLGSVIKYVWRADEKWDTIEDLNKAKWYLEREIERREREAGRRH